MNHPRKIQGRAGSLLLASHVHEQGKIKSCLLHCFSVGDDKKCLEKF